MELSVEEQDAVDELKRFITDTSILLEKQGWTWFVSKDRELTEKYSPELAKAKRIPITPDGSKKTIYGMSVNTLLRFWHDVTHLSLGLGYDEKSEYMVIAAQLRSMEKAGLSIPACRLFWADMWGQVVYYSKHEKFVEDQKAFATHAYRYGIPTACNYMH